MTDRAALYENSSPFPLPIMPGNVPALLTALKRWVVWRPGQPKPSGKFDKIPIDHISGRAINPLVPANWLSFAEAVHGCRRGGRRGIGIVLSDEPLLVDGNPLYLTALDFDQCAHQLHELKELWINLGKPYVEESPSGKGLRMLGLSQSRIRGGNAGAGREMYSSGRFMTITGVNARGTVRDFTAGVSALEQRWFPRLAQPKPKAVRPSAPETRENVSLVLAMLDCVTSDTDYETYRDIVWSIASTGWKCAYEVARKWSARARHRFEAVTLDRLLTDFDPMRGITLGTLVHHARENGWSGISAPAVVAASSAQKLLLTAAELRQQPSTPYVVRGIFPARGLAAIYGEPGCGKSFVALDLAHAIAAGRSDWFGFPVQQTPVAYVALEGQAGLGKRTLALEAHTKIECPATLQFWRLGLNMRDKGAVDQLGAEVLRAFGRRSVIIIDTLNQASPGADENSSAEMGAIIANAKRLGDDTDALIIFVHHSGKDRSRGLRGHSSLFAAMDAVLEVHAAAAGRQLLLTKAKDDLAFVSRGFELVTYGVGSDGWGALTSCAVRPAVHVKPAMKRPIAGKHQKHAMDKLRSLLSDNAARIQYHAAISAVAADLDARPDRARARAKEAIDSLIRAGHVSHSEGGLCIPSVE